MTRLVPPAAQLLQATAEYLEQELLPTLSGYHRFQTRIGINVLQIVMREMRCSDKHAAAELERIAMLLGRNCRGSDLAALNGELADAIADGRIALDAPGLIEHLRLTLRDALAIDSPKWIEVDPPQQI